jgi:cytochrome P450
MWIFRRRNCPAVVGRRQPGDPTVFESPDEVVLGRPRRHVAFGRDIHYCVGAPLARLEARVVLTVLLKSISSITLDPDQPPRWVNSLMVRRHQPLPVQLIPGQ